MKYIIRRTTTDSYEDFICRSGCFGPNEEDAFQMSLEVANQILDFQLKWGFRHMISKFDICEASSSTCVITAYLDETT